MMAMKKEEVIDDRAEMGLEMGCAKKVSTPTISLSCFLVLHDTRDDLIVEHTY
jgi:hypothetical protein